MFLIAQGTIDELKKANRTSFELVYEIIRFKHELNFKMV